MTEEVRIPDIGDVEHVEVIEICVAVGDTVGPDDALIVIESDKASMEVPAGKAGTVSSIEVSVGDEVTEGSLIVTLASEGATGSEKPSKQAPEPASAPVDAAAADATPDPEVSEPQASGSDAAGSDEGPEPPAGSDQEARTLEVRVPDIGEATNVEVIEVAVKEGDQVGADDLLVVVESDKASMEIPAGAAGTVVGVHVSVGTEVVEGTLLATIRVEGGTAAKPSSAGGSRPASGKSPDVPADSRPASKPAGEQAPEERPAESRPAAADVSGDQQAPSDDRKIYAGPAVRRLARELGVTLASIRGSGNRGRILKEDVKAHVKSAMTSRSTGTGSGAGGIPPVPAVDFSRFGPIEVQPLSRIRRSGASNLHRSWLNLPHVTQFEEADVTELEEFRGTLKEEAQRRDVKITPLAFIIKACCYALQAFPTFNASLDPEIRNFVLKKYYHIGFAVDTPDGLVVPVIRDANRLGVWDLSRAIIELSEKARTQKLGMGDMQGGSFSISSLGNIGGTGFTPIINAPEVAILGVSRLVTRPVWNGKEFEPRKMLPLSLSYDHRAINGAEAGRFMAMLSELLADIRRLSL